MATKTTQNNNNKSLDVLTSVNSGAGSSKAGGEKTEVISQMIIVCDPNDVDKHYRTTERSILVPSKLFFRIHGGDIAQLKKKWTKLQWGEIWTEVGIDVHGNPIPPIQKIRFKVGPYVLDNDESIANYFGPNGIFGPDEKITAEVKHWTGLSEQVDADDAEDIEIYLEEQAEKNLNIAAKNARKRRNNIFKTYSIKQYDNQVEPYEDKVENHWNKLILDIKNIQNDENVIVNLSKKLTELDNFIKKNRKTIISHPMAKYYFKEIQQLIFKRHKDLHIPGWAWTEFIAPQFHSIMGLIKLSPAEEVIARKMQKNTEMRAHGAFPPLRKYGGTRKRRKRIKTKRKKRKRRKTRKKKRRKTRKNKH